MARHHNINGNIVPFTAEEEAQRDAEEAAFAEAQANEVSVDTNTSLCSSKKTQLILAIGDQLDMLWHSIDQNPALKSEYFEFYEAIKAVKVKHPKNG